MTTGLTQNSTFRPKNSTSVLIVPLVRLRSDARFWTKLRHSVKALKLFSKWNGIL